MYDPRRTLRAVDEIQQVIGALVISALCLADRSTAKVPAL